VDPCGQDIQRLKIADDDFQSSRKGKPLRCEKISQIVMQIISLVLNLKHPTFWKDIPAKKKIKRERKKQQKVELRQGRDWMKHTCTPKKTKKKKRELNKEVRSESSSQIKVKC